MPDDRDENALERRLRRRGRWMAVIEIFLGLGGAVLCVLLWQRMHAVGMARGRRTLIFLVVGAVASAGFVVSGLRGLVRGEREPEA